jgi:hypothetical protein
MRSPVTVAVATAAILAASLAYTTAARADCLNGVYDEPLPPITSIAPAPDAAFEQSYVYPVHFTVVTPIHFAGFYIRVSSRPQLGETGILSDLVDLDDTILTESATDHDYYFGQSSLEIAALDTWTDVPGTYYWQLFGSWSDYSFNCHAFAGPINTITITPSPPSTPPATPMPAQPIPSSPTHPIPSSPEQPITTRQAQRYAVGMVRARTGWRPRIRLRCMPTDTRTLHCDLRWSAGGFSYLAAGQFTRPSATTFAYDFRGTRGLLRCNQGHRCSMRETRFHWVGHS